MLPGGCMLPGDLHTPSRPERVTVKLVLDTREPASGGRYGSGWRVTRYSLVEAQSRKAER